MGLSAQLDFDVNKTAAHLSEFIRASIQKHKARGIVIGLSGGIDSACVCGLAVKAIGPDRVFGLILPEQDSDPQSAKDAELVANTYGVRIHTIDITPILDAFGIYELIPKDIFSKRDKVAKLVKLGYSLFPKSHSPFIGGFQGTKFEFQRKIQAYYRIKHRVRMVHFYYYAEQLNYLVAGTSNRTEELTGFFVKYGDSAADIMPIINLYKTQVRKLSHAIGVPRQVIEKPSIPDLIPGIEDEGVIGLSYEKLDLILAGLTNGTSEEEITRELEISGRLIRYVKKIVSLSQPLRELPIAPSWMGSQDSMPTDR